MALINAWVGLCDLEGCLVGSRQSCIFIDGASVTPLTYVVDRSTTIGGFDMAITRTGDALLTGGLDGVISVSSQDAVILELGKIELLTDCPGVARSVFKDYVAPIAEDLYLEDWEKVFNGY